MAERKRSGELIPCHKYDKTRIIRLRLAELTPRSKLSVTPDEALRAIRAPEQLHHDSPWDNFCELLTARGFYPFEPGAFGVAFAHDDLDYVIKVFNTSKDVGYLAFLKYCAANRGNPHLPVFRGKVMRIEGTIFWCRLELLDHLMNETQTRLLSVNKIMSQALDETGQVPTVDQIKAASDDPDDLQHWGLTNQFLQTLVDLAKENQRLGYYFDCHGNNVMERNDLTLVVTDPFDSWG